MGAIILTLLGISFCATIISINATFFLYARREYRRGDYAASFAYIGLAGFINFGMLGLLSIAVG